MPQEEKVTVSLPEDLSRQFEHLRRRLFSLESLLAVTLGISALLLAYFLLFVSDRFLGYSFVAAGRTICRGCNRVPPGRFLVAPPLGNISARSSGLVTPGPAKVSTPGRSFAGHCRTRGREEAARLFLA